MKKKNLIIFLILIILFIIIFFLKNSAKLQTSDDFLFLKLFSNGESLSSTQDNENYSTTNRKLFNNKPEMKSIKKYINLK